MNPGSRLADLGQQRLATALGEACEGKQHNYVVLYIPFKSFFSLQHLFFVGFILQVACLSFSY